MLGDSRRSGSAKAAWWAVLAMALSAIALALVADPNPERQEQLRRLAKVLLGSSLTTVGLLGASIGLATVGGILVGWARVSRAGWLQFAGAAYADAVRGIPLYVLLLFVYFVLGGWLSRATDGGVILSSFWAAVAALALCYSAYIGEVIRAGIQAIPPEEIEAAALEATRVQSFVHVILPQAFRIILPSWTNELVAMLKDTSLVSAVALADMTFRAKEFGSSTGLYFEALGGVALVYLVFTLILTQVAQWLERACALDRPSGN